MIMAVTVKYQGVVKNAPVLHTHSGSYPFEPVTPPGGLELRPVGAGLATRATQGSIYELARAAEQERVLGELDFMLQNLSVNLTYPQTPDAQPNALGRLAVSSDPTAILASAAQTAQAPTTHEARVLPTATGGVVMGKTMNPIAPVSLAAGAYRFTMTIDGQARQIDMNVGEGQTNEEFIGRLAIAIASQDERIQAKAVYGFEDAYDPGARTRPMNRTVRLVVSGPEDQTGPSFYFGEDSAGVVEAFGLNLLSPPRTAVARLDGVAQAQTDNAISLDGGAVTGLASGDGAAVIEVTAGAPAVSQRLSAIIERFNEIIAYIDLHADVLRPSLKDRLTRPGEDLARLLPKIGLRATAQGKIVVSQGFAEAVKADYATARELLLGQDGWMTKLSGKVGQILAMDKSFWADPPDFSKGAAQRAWALIFDVSQSIISGYY